MSTVCDRNIQKKKNCSKFSRRNSRLASKKKKREHLKMHKIHWTCMFSWDCIGHFFFIFWFCHESEMSFHMLNISFDLNHFWERDRVYFCFYSFTKTSTWTNKRTYICIISSHRIVIFFLIKSMVCVFSHFSRKKSLFSRSRLVWLWACVSIHIPNVLCVPRALCLFAYFDWMCVHNRIYIYICTRW